MINDEDIVRWAYLLGPTFQIENTEGRPLTGGWMEVYIHGTRNKYYCASDFDGTLHPFKIQLDSLGSNIVLASPVHSYDIYVYNKFGSLVMSRYNVVPATGEGTYIGDIVTIDSPDNTVDVSTDSGTNWHISIKDTVDTLELLQNEVATAVTSINDRIDGIDLALGNKKDKQSALTFNGSATKTVKKITQNTNGVITVEYEDIDLPPEVPNVEITSPNGTINVQSSTDVQTNTKTFEIDVSKTTLDFFDGYMGKLHYEDRNPNTTDTPIACYVDEWSEYKYQGDFITNDWQANNNINFVLKPGLYLITADIRYDMHNEWSDPSNPNPSKSNTDQYIRIATGAYNGLENGTRYKDWTQEYRLGENTIQLSFVRNVMNDRSYIYMNDNKWLYFDPYLPYGVNYVQLDHLQIVKLDSIVGATGTGGLDKVYHDSSLSGDGTQANPLSVVSGGNNYTALEPMYINGDNQVFLDYVAPFVKTSGKLGISLNGALEVNQASLGVKVNPSSGIDIVNDELVVKVGKGLQIDPTSGLVVIDTEVGDVVETVEKLKLDLDTQITTNFDMPNISQVYDFADGSNWITHNGACMLYQAFTIPINHEVRTTTDDPNTPTLMGIYAQQGFSGKKIMLALYEYTYPKAGESNGSSTYVGDTGPVDVKIGMNEFPLKNRNPSITELRSDKVYYASLYLPSNAFANGLLLAGAPSYGNQSIPAEPRLTCATENITYNGSEMDMSDPTTTLNHYTTYTLPDGTIYYQYDIGPWSGGYNERWSTPRFYLQIRNGEYNTPIIPTAPFEDLGDSKLPDQFDLVSNLPVPTGWTWSSDNSSFVDVQPLADCSITEYEYIDDMANAPGYVSQHCVYNSDYSTHLGGTATVTDLGQAISITQSGTTVIGYRHKVTFSSPISLTAGTTYRFLAECFNSSSSHIFGWTTPTNVVDSCNNGWYVDYQQTINRYPNLIGKYLRLTDSNNNHYVI